LLTPASLLDDSPAQIATANGLYLPQNYDREWKGFVSARTALGASLNVPAVRVAGLLGPDALHQRLRRFGFELPESAGWYGASLALGSADVSLLALSNAYRTLANGGLASPALLKRGGAAVRPVRVADAAAVHLVTDILADNNARARTFGLASAPGDARLRRGEDRHQQGHARQLVRRLHRPLHDRRLGRQRRAARRCTTSAASAARRRSGMRSPRRCTPARCRSRRPRRPA
jgi:hypothetical protein